MFRNAKDLRNPVGVDPSLPLFSQDSGQGPQSWAGIRNAVGVAFLGHDALPSEDGRTSASRPGAFWFRGHVRLPVEDAGTSRTCPRGTSGPCPLGLEGGYTTFEHLGVRSGREGARRQDAESTGGQSCYSRTIARPGSFRRTRCPAGTAMVGQGPPYIQTNRRTRSKRV